MSLITAPTAARMLVLNRELVHRATKSGKVDETVAAVAFLYIRRLERELADGVVSGETAMREAGDMARAAQNSRRDQRTSVRPVPVPVPAPAPTLENTMVRTVWARPTPLPVAKTEAEDDGD